MPSDMSAVWGYDQRYLQANWRGDLVRRVWLNGDAGTEMAYDPWGSSVRGLHYYEWNGAWGYMAFGALQLYYAHGRWYNPETALWLSPDENGEYLYGSGQDAVNWAWRVPQLCRPSYQLEQTDCERFVEEVRRIIYIAQSAGASDDVVVMLLTQYYSGMNATWQFGDWILASPPGFALPNYQFTRERWQEPEHIHDSPEVRRQYGFKRPFFTNTHHYFADFYTAWFWGPNLSWSVNTVREIYQNRFTGQAYFEGAADVAIQDIAIRHVQSLYTLRFSSKRAIQQLPQLLAQDACANSDKDVFSRWPPPEIEKILGPTP